MLQPARPAPEARRHADERQAGRRKISRRYCPTPVLETALFRALLHGEALLLQQALQLAGLEHLADDVAAADELALDVKLGNGRPVGIGLDAVAKLVVLQHVQSLIGHAEM